MGSVDSSPTVAIAYGLGEGPAISRRLREGLAEKGYALIDNVSQADIVIAHSGGIYSLPTDATNKVVLLVGPSCGRRGRSLARMQFNKVGIDLRFAVKHRRVGGWLRKSYHNAAYVTRDPCALRAMWRVAQSKGNFLPALNADKVAVISYKGDPWSGYIDAQQVASNEHYSFIEHNGLHDDLWTNPQEYISVIQYLYES
ncbi:MAG: hypothetical protein AAB834_03990 [Patescibacteria group bacterium]